MEGLVARGVPLKAREVVPIRAADFPTRAVRPANSRLDTARLAQQFGITMPAWRDSLAVELDAFLADERTRAGRPLP
jgi:dTDP-4-dehydrorhamnose reductase